MALHEQSVGATDEWYTPARIFEAMGVRFDQDPAPGPIGTPARMWCGPAAGADGLACPWRGFVWLNPPFGPRNGLAPWLGKFIAHGNGVCLVPDRTSAPWWQRAAPSMDAILFVSPKIRFVDALGREGASPAQGTCLMAIGASGEMAVRNAAADGLGVILRPS